MNNPTTLYAGVDQLAESKLQQQRGRQRQEPLGAHPGPPQSPGRPPAGVCGNKDSSMCVSVSLSQKYLTASVLVSCLPEAGLP